MILSQNVGGKGGGRIIKINNIGGHGSKKVAHHWHKA